MSEIAATQVPQVHTRTSERTWPQRLVVPLLLGHLAALAFGLGGLLIALPNPELWADSATGARTFDFGMTYGGSLHIIFGALTMLAFGAATIGWRKTGTFFVVAYVLSISSELIGTGTGWPFGNYEYTSFLGYQVLGRVPFTIPLSWFYVGFSSYLLANLLFTNRQGWQRGALAVIGGAYLLTVWDLVLDPAMAHDSLAVRFWIWSETGPYFGMPIKNFIGWTLTAAAFMAVSRWLWREDAEPREYPGWLPFTVYLANVIFAIALSLSVGLWEPALLALVFGVVPAALAWRAQWLNRRAGEVSHGTTG
jgi:carotene biosynthesis associated membrane protein